MLECYKAEKLGSFLVLHPARGGQAFQLSSFLALKPYVAFLSP
jgi:hypothetical protein